MSGGLLYLKCRRVPQSLALAALVTAVTWSLWLAFSDDRDVDAFLMVLIMVLLVATVASTLVAPDVALERTAALRWPWWRTAHLVTAAVVMVGLLALSLPTAARFAPLSVVVRDSAGLLGLAALGATLLSARRGWFLPVLWTLPALVIGSSFEQSDLTAEGRFVARLLTWQLQAPHDQMARTTAVVLTIAGLVAYAWRGPALRSDEEEVP